MIVYYKLDSLLVSKGIKKIDLQRKLGISPSTMANFSKNKYVAMSIIDKICKELQCQPGDIMAYVDENEAEIASIEAQIAELEAKKKQLQGKEE
jgi:DNA-binding Xre family transcriptional regulator|nr:MAG TPA: Cro/C1-type HTH DNA-binding domain protein [Caudoviricetes sp.]